MSKVIFDGQNKLIIIKTGVTNIDVGIDLYSDWKEWVIDNPNWLPAFRTFGGDETTPGQYAPRYYFLINNWRVLANNVNCVLQTNLYSDDYDSPFIINNAGVTSRTSDVPIIKTELEKRLDYNDRIYIDFNSVYNGTDYPNGTIAQPINNIFDAILVANQYNISTFYSLSDLDFTNITGNTFSDYSFYAEKENLKITSYNNIFNIIYWDGFIIDMDFNNGYNKLNDCVIFNAVNINGKLEKCQINGSIKIDTKLVMSNCYSGIANSGTTPVYDMNSGKTTIFSNRAYSGNITLINCDTSGCTTTQELIAGKIKIEPSCTNGYIDLRGVGYLIDNSSGSTINKKGFIDSFGSYLDKSKEFNESLIYSNTIYYDVNNGYTGNTYPIGTIVKPVNNIDDLYHISLDRNIKNIISKSDFIISAITYNLDSYTITSDNINNKFILDNSNISNFKIENFKIKGNYNGNSHDFVKCEIIDVYDLSGRIFNSNIEGIISIKNNTTFIDCHPSFADGKGHIIMNNSNGTKVSFRNYNGSLEFINVTNDNDKISIDLNAGHVTFMSGCTNGFADIRGVGYITDKSTGTFRVKREGQLQSTPYYYNETIIIDTINGKTGNMYPIGTIDNPVNNLTDALYLLNKYKLNTIRIIGSLLIDNGENISDITFTANNNEGNLLTITNAITNNTYINNLTVNIVQSGTCQYLTCTILNIDNFDGSIKDSLIIGNIKLSGNNTNYITNCNTYTTNINSYINISVNDKKLNIIKCSGFYKILDKANSDTIIIDINNGQLLVDNTCTNGTIYINGIGNLIDNSNSGCTVINKLLNNDQITDHVWDEQISEHQLTGSTGYALNNISSGADPIAIANQVWNTQLSTGYTINSAGYMMSIIFENNTGQTNLSEISQNIKRILGLTQENIIIKDHIYDSSDLLQSATIRIFNNSTDVNNDINPLAEYTMSALYDSKGRLTNYKVIKN